MFDPRMRLATNTMAVSIQRILADAHPSIYLYGSVTTEDFRPGWSDIDLLVLTEDPITADQADALLYLRQTLVLRDPDTPHYGLFEGGMLDLGSYLTGDATRVVYWGTTGQSIRETHTLSAFDLVSLHQTGQLLLGKDVRHHLDKPDHAQVIAAVKAHLETIRQHGRGARNFFAYGWLLDIARCLYVLRNGRPIAKTDAGQWALDERICPCPGELSIALLVRRQPEFLQDEGILAHAERLTPAIQLFADVLEKALGTE